MLEAEFTPRGARRPTATCRTGASGSSSPKKKRRLRGWRERSARDGRVQSLCYAAPTAGCLTSPLASDWNRTCRRPTLALQRQSGPGREGHEVPFLSDFDAAQIRVAPQGPRIQRDHVDRCRWLHPPHASSTTTLPSMDGEVEIAAENIDQPLGHRLTARQVPAVRTAAAVRGAKDLQHRLEGSRHEHDDRDLQGPGAAARPASLRQRRVG